MTIENHTLREELIVNVSIDQIPYTNDRVGPVVSNVINALNYLFASIYPNYIGQFNTPAQLPVSAFSNDYAYVIDDGDGKGAAYIYVTLDNVNQWVKKYDYDWSMDGLVQDVIGQTFPLYTFSNGRIGGQTIYGGTQPEESLEFNANAADNSGEIITHNHFTPKVDNAVDLGKLDNRFRDLYISNLISDGNVYISPTEIKNAIEHLLINSGNPHSVSYDELVSKIGTITLAGGVTGSINLASSGDKTLVVSVANNGHTHNKFTLPDFDTDVYNKVKSILVDSDGIYFTPDDASETIAPAKADIDTSEITDIESPSAGKVLVANPAGDEWVGVTPTVTVTGKIEAEGAWNGSLQKFEIAASKLNANVSELGDITILSKPALVTIGTETILTTMTPHGLNSGEKIYIPVSQLADTTPSIKDQTYTVTRLSSTSFSIPVETIAESGPVYYIPQGAQLLFNPATRKWEVAKEFEEININELSGVDADFADQYALLAGRDSGQQLVGGVNAGEDLILDSTSHATKGTIKLKSKLAPHDDAAYSGTWSGTDIGSASLRFNNLFLAGELKGARVENVSSTPSSSGQHKGRIVYNTSEDKLYYDNGILFKPLSSSTIPTKLISFSAETSKAVDMSSALESDKYTSDYGWVMMDQTTNEFVPAVITRTTSKALSITLEVPITGSFLIKGI